MLNDMKSSDDLFKPTNFWSKEIKRILHDLKNNKDFSIFRMHKTANYMYVPVYYHLFYKNQKVNCFYFTN